MARFKIIKGFSKLKKEEKLRVIASYFENPGEVIGLLKSFWYADSHQQQIFDEFSENTISNYHIPYGVCPNVIINGKTYMVPMTIEESSVVAAASAAAKFWDDCGGFRAEVVDVKKIGQIHFCWKGSKDKLSSMLPELKRAFRDVTAPMTEKMEKRGGGMLDVELRDFTDRLPNYYQFLVTFDTCDSMGANFINSVLEEMGRELKRFLAGRAELALEERECEVVMTILSNYTPDCRVRVWVECEVSKFDNMIEGMTGMEYAMKFKKAVDIAVIDKYRAATHNKGIYNGIDAVVIATGNDFRATEAAGHAYASRNGSYSSLSHAEIEGTRFRFTLEVPMALGTVGGLTSLHPLARKSLEMLGNPTAKELMMIAATMGLANNFAAVRSLTTRGIQAGHMKMHLTNILNQIGATDTEKALTADYFRDKTVTFAGVEHYVNTLRLNNKD